MEGNACKICTYNFMHIFVMDTIQKKRLKYFKNMYVF